MPLRRHRAESLVDRTSAKRPLIVAGALTVTAGTLAMPLVPRFPAIVVVAGYQAAFISLGIIAAAGLVLYAAAMPETGPKAARKPG